MSNLGKNLKALRKKAHLKQHHIAEAIGISRSAYAYYETGNNMPKMERLVKLADIFNVSVDELLGDLNETAINNENKLNSSIPPYKDNEGYKVSDKFNDLSEFEKMMILKMRLMTPEEKDELQKHLYDTEENK